MLCGSSSLKLTDQGDKGMKRQSAILLILILGLANLSVARNITDFEATATFQPVIAHLKLKADDLRSLAGRQVVVRGVRTSNSKEMAGFGAVILDTTPESFIDTFRTLAMFKTGSSAQGAGVFKSTPDLADLDQLNIDDKDLIALSKCRTNDSDIKLSEAEISRIQAVAKAAPRLTPQIKTRLAAEYKKILVDRVKTYMADSAAGLGVYADKEDPVNSHEAFAVLAKEQVTGTEHCAHLYPGLEKYSEAAPETESFIYWAKQKFGDLKPVINLVHVLIHKEGSRVFIASKQIYSSHYTEAGLSVLEMIPFNDEQGQARSVVAYTIRLQVDMLGGMLGSMKKRMAQPRFLTGLKESLSGLNALHLNVQATMRAAANKSAANKAGL